MRPPPHTTLVTGGGGFLGSHVVSALQSRGRRVLSVEPTPTAWLAPPGASEIRSVVDVRDRDALTHLADSEHVDGVIHCAALAGVGGVDVAKYEATSVNVQGMAVIADIVENLGIPRMVDCSSEEVYGQPPVVQVDENTHTSPNTGYGTHKLICEQLGQWWLGGHGRYVAARLSWIYGPGFRRDRPPAPWLRDAATGKVSTGHPAAVDHRVDLLYVTDAAEALVALLDTPNPRYCVYNVSSGRTVTLGAVAATLRDIEPAWSCALVDGALSDIAERPLLLNHRVTAQTGWRPKVSLESGLADSLMALRIRAAAPH